ncbi:MAG: DNA (cytosine-5-)-methyltransferase [Brevundimonas sp.]|uniref:DNA (cytosine-5-)-methyltransferase n=1 Tax=Brevundimonas sp. TaxID=1871086 RepID=UPI00260840B0|nr:DNA (cytosine-5-)-methyltransferase [Brevundimonas sp.]MDI6625331.1 DNA (cytosine-5-)-methyltransferase [Brevundimonas sp.]MDQ7813948.1 DNA (cytosine-5-)-methyltransferase [Brevundimonas sp.]
MSEYALMVKQAGQANADKAVDLGFIEGPVRPAAKQPALKLIRGDKDSEPADFTFIDLFAGIGGLRRGFESIGGRCVFTSEWDKYSQKTYRANFPDDDHEINGDITKIEAGDIPAHDVLLAGFPCQPFSIAGVSKKNALGRAHGFEDKTQGTLFYDVARIIAHHRPAAFLLENVRNLVSHDKGKTFQTIKDVLTEELGYTIDFRVIDGRHWTPQHRERIFIIGFREDQGFRFADMKLPDAAPKLETILHPGNGSEVPDQRFTVGNSGRVSDKYTLTDHLWNYLQRYKEKHQAAGNGFGFGLVGPDDVARTLSARYYKDGSEILVKQEDGKAPRRLTPRECARLMGFDAPQGNEFLIPVSDTQAYRQFGNSVVVPAVKAVAEHMKPHLFAALGKRPKAAIG